MLILQEADELLYRAALSIEKRCYEVVLEDGTIIDYGNNLTKTELKDLYPDSTTSFRLYRETEPLENAIMNLESMISEIMKHGTDIKMFLTPSDKSNFRFPLATIKPYKYGRPDKPLYYREVRDYLIDCWAATELTGYEADDGLGIYADGECILSHIDKDINMIPGKHLNWLTGETYECTDPGNLTLQKKNKLKGGGLKFFYAQMLTGDSVDAIPGVGGIGPVRACKLLNELETEEQFLKCVVDLYRDKHPETWKDRLIEVAGLLWICRNRHENGSQRMERLLDALL